MTFVLRETVSEAAWPSLSRLIRIAFYGLNIGLAMMVVLSLFPGGIMQVHDVIQNGYWHARSLAYTATPLARTLEWLRMPGDLVFMFAGALPLAAAMTSGYLNPRKANYSSHGNASSDQLAPDDRRPENATSTLDTPGEER